MGHSLDDLYDLIGLALSMLKQDSATLTTLATYKEIIGRRAPEGGSFYNRHGEFDLKAFLCTLSLDMQLTDAEREARAKTRPTLQLVQAIMTAVDRTRAVLRNNTIFQCHAARIEELVYENNLAHLCLAIEVLNWFAMKNDGKRSYGEIRVSWVESGCSRAFASRFGVTICDYFAAMCDMPSGEMFATFTAKWAKKDNEKYAGPAPKDGAERPVPSLDGIYDDLQVAMGNDARTLDAIIRIANHGDVDALCSRFPDIVSCLCSLVLEVRATVFILHWKWDHDKPAHVESVDDVAVVLPGFEQSRTRAIVHNIIDRACAANTKDPADRAAINHYHALMSAVKTLLIHKGSMAVENQ
jgi:hypothetical protein